MSRSIRASARSARMRSSPIRTWSNDPIWPPVGVFFEPFDVGHDSAVPTVVECDVQPVYVRCDVMADGGYPCRTVGGEECEVACLAYPVGFHQNGALSSMVDFV
jgi:hypothetical protein